MFYAFKPFSILKFPITKRFFSVIVLSLKKFHVIFIMKKKIIMKFTPIKYDITVSPFLRLFLRVWIWYRHKNKIEKHYHHDQEQQLSFSKEAHFKTGWVNRRIFLICFLFNFCVEQKPITKIEGFQFICLTKTVSKTLRNAILFMKKVNLDELSNQRKWRRGDIFLYVPGTSQIISNETSNNASMKRR